jgi:RsmE family RNA methyltransferase
MNLILFEQEESLLHLSSADSRTEHIRKILRAQPGDVLRVGRIGTGVGEARVESIGSQGVDLTILRWADAPRRPQLVIRLLLGMPRPLTAKRILKDLATLAVDSIDLFHSDLGERSYQQSTLWERTRVYLVEGAAQGGHPWLPTVRRFESLDTAVEAVLPEPITQRGMPAQPQVIRYAAVCRDTVQRASMMSMVNRVHGALHGSTTDGDISAVVEIAVGSERGFSDAEIALLERKRYRALHLGSATLRTETAVTALCTALRAVD